MNKDALGNAIFAGKMIGLSVIQRLNSPSVYPAWYLSGSAGDISFFFKCYPEPINNGAIIKRVMQNGIEATNITLPGLQFPFPWEVVGPSIF